MSRVAKELDQVVGVFKINSAQNSVDTHQEEQDRWQPECERFQACWHDLEGLCIDISESMPPRGSRSASTHAK